jgi:hypothetical protein
MPNSPRKNTKNTKENNFPCALCVLLWQFLKSDIGKVASRVIRDVGGDDGTIARTDA